MSMTPDEAARRRHRETGDAWPVITTEAPALTHDDCLDNHGEGTCGGNVEYRMALSGTGKSFPRCDRHWDERLAVQDGINERYPTHAPSDFDPLYAGERWDDDY